MTALSASEFLTNHHRELLTLATATLLLLQLKKFFNGGYFIDKITRMDGKTVVITGANCGIIIIIKLKKIFIKFKDLISG